MHKLDVSGYKKFSDLPLQEFEKAEYSVYLVSLDWEYMFVNTFVEGYLNRKRSELIGKNIWKTYPAMNMDPDFVQMRQNCERGIETNILTNSPINHKRLSLLAYPLEDCYVFLVSVLPGKEDLLLELREQIRKRK